MSTQRRGRAIAMSRKEIDEFLAIQRTCRVGTVGATGAPHVTPLWFAWDTTALWLYSIVNSQRWIDVSRDPRMAVVVDTGEDYHELRGVEMAGTATAVGDAPRTGGRHPQLAEPERLFAEKYFSGAPFSDDGRHGWLRMTPSTMTSWDFRKLPDRNR